MDVVIPVGGYCDVKNYWELRLCLRSLYFNYDNIFNVILVGALPEWANTKKIIHIPAGDPYKANKDANLIAKVILACQLPELSDRFIFMNDDQYVLKKVTDEDFLKARISNMFFLSPKEGQWATRRDRTVEKLKENGKLSNLYEAHCPYVFEKSKYPKALLAYDYGVGAGYLANTIYYSETELDPASAKGPSDVLYFDDSKHNAADLTNGLYTFMNRNSMPSEKFIKILGERFPQSSPFEID